MITRRILTILIATALAGLMASAVLAQLPAGKKAPDFSLTDLNGKKVTLSSYFAKPGKVVVLDLWATWCPPCKREIPFLIDLSKKYLNKGVAFIGVALDGEKSKVTSFVKEQGINYTILHDPNGQTVSSLYNARSIPETYIIDRNGVIKYVHVGFSGKDDAYKIENEIKKLLAQK
jgi:DsbE subfamily thiol:disulfide oxidoreductase